MNGKVFISSKECRHYIGTQYDSYTLEFAPEAFFKIRFGQEYSESRVRIYNIHCVLINAEANL